MELPFIFIFNSGHFVGYTPVHVGGRLFKDVAKTVFQCILVYPHSGSEFVTAGGLKKLGIEFDVAGRNSSLNYDILKLEDYRLII